MSGLANITRRRAVSSLLVSLVMGQPLRIVKADARVFAIAIPDFQGGSQDELEKGHTVAQVIVSDLRTSGRFVLLDPNLYAEKRLNVDTTPQFADWRVIGAEYLVTGQLALRSNEHVKVEFRLWDTVAGQQIVGVQYSVTSGHLHRVPHAIADALYERLTGQVGRFADENRG